MLKVRWLIYTVLIGLVPFLVRALLYMVVNDVPVTYILNEVDMVAFGLILNISNINEIDSVGNDMEPIKKTINIGLSLFLIVLFGAFLTVAYISELPKMSDIFNRQFMKLICIGLCVVSFFFSYSIFRRLS